MNLKGQLESKGVTIYRLAKDLDISYATAKTWVENPKAIRLDKLYKIADYLDLNIKDLI